MAHDPAAVSLELAEARAAHANLLTQIQRRMRELDDKWRAAKAADRLLAVQRLLHTGAVAEDRAAAIEAKNERVRELIGRARTDRKKLERVQQEGGETHEMQHALFLLELDAQRAEKERDALVDELDLRGPLYFCGETFIRSEPFGPKELPLKDMTAKAQTLQDKIQSLEKYDRKGVRFTTTLPDGREKTLIRMLPALTQEGEAHVDEVSDDELPAIGPDAAPEDPTTPR